MLSFQLYIVLAALLALFMIGMTEWRVLNALQKMSASLLYIVLVLALIQDSDLVARSATTKGLLLGAIVAALGVLLTLSVTLGKQRHWRLSPVPLIVLLPSFIFFVINGLKNPEYPDVLIFGRLASVIALFCLIAICALSKLDVQSVAQVVLAAILTAVVLSPIGDYNWRPCDRFKCGPFGAIYTGIFPSENALALYCSVGVVSAMLLRRRATRFIASATLVSVIYATESRTSQLALAISLVTWLVVHLGSKGVGKVGDIGIRQTLLIRGMFIATSVVFAIGLYLVNTASSDKFSNRGGIWKRGIDALGSEWVTGVGMDRWSYLQSVGMLPPLFPHSQYLLLLFGGGATAVLTVAVILNVAYRAQVRSGRAIGFATAFVAFVSVIGLTEIYWNPGAIDGQLVVLTPLIFMLLASSAASHQVVPVTVRATLKT